jgi:dihydrofolate reductase
VVPSTPVRWDSGAVNVLSYGVLCSLDGYVEDATGGFDWAVPDDEVHAFVNEQERAVSTYLYGRRLYETMKYWQTAGTDPAQPGIEREYAEVWRAADKVVFSTSLAEVDTPRTRLVRSFDADEVRRLKEDSSGELTVGGPGLAAAALQAGLVDELRLLVVPVVVGAGKPALPPGYRASLTLLGERRFAGGTVQLRYKVG